MKIWNSYGSEHSANMVMIGRFKDAESAEAAMAAIKKIENLMISGQDDHEEASRYSDEAFELLNNLKIYSLGPSELNQFVYEIHTEVDENTITIKTQESEISAFLKVMIDKGAKVEAFSGHDYPKEADPA